jgi:hypothetical protein
LLLLLETQRGGAPSPHRALSGPLGPRRGLLPPPSEIWRLLLWGRPCSRSPPLKTRVGGPGGSGGYGARQRGIIGWRKQCRGGIEEASVVGRPEPSRQKGGQEGATLSPFRSGFGRLAGCHVRGF